MGVQKFPGVSSAPLTAVGPFAIALIAVSHPRALMDALVPGITGVVMPDSGRLFGFSGLLSAALDAGELHMSGAIDQVQAGAGATVIDNTGEGFFLKLPTVERFQAGSEVGLFLDTDENFLPALTLNLVAYAWVACDYGSVPG